MAELPKFEPIPLEFDEREVPLCRWDDGTVRVVGSRIPFGTIAHRFRAGDNAADITDGFPSLSGGTVEALIAFCARHSREVDAYLSDLDRQEQRIQAAVERSYPSGPLMKRLKARWAERNAEVPH